MSNKVVKNKNNSTLKQDYFNTVTSIFTFVICTIFPLYVRNKYFDILGARYQFYYISVILLAAALLVCTVAGGAGKLKKFSVKKAACSMTAADKAVFIFWLVCGISMFSSHYFYESFWGNEGRYTGFFLISLYVFSYFCVSRLWKFKNWYVDAFLVTAMLVCVFGITDYFQMDIMNFKYRVVADQLDKFTSTFGNINTYTSYVAMVMAVSAVLFSTSVKKMRAVIYYLCMVISFFAIIMGVSDNAYLAIAALFGFLPLYLFGKEKGVRNYFVIVASFFTVVLCIGWINTNMADVVLGIDSAFNVIAGFGGLPYITLGLWLIAAVLYAVSAVQKEKIAFHRRWLQYGWLALVILCALALVWAFYDSNVAGNASRYGALQSYLVFNEGWGTDRGFVWKRSIERFGEFSWWQKIVGFGPDTFKMAFNGGLNNQIYDSAHNEYLQYLLTIGIAGMAAWLAFLGLYVWRIFRRGAGNPYIVALAFGIICYAAQALVNISVPVMFPIVWIFLAMGMAGVKKAGDES